MQRWRPRLGLALPAAGLVFSLAVAPTVNTLASRRVEPLPTAAERRPASELALYLISEPIQPAEKAVRNPFSLEVRSYRVQKGDSLSSIAQRFGLAVDTVISFNGIRSARALAAGAELKIPSVDGLAYTVRRGDTLTDIAARNGVALESLLDWNGLEAETIHPGQQLFLPGARLPASVRDSVLGRLMVFPVKGELSSRFGWRQNPFTGIREHHGGIDLRAPIGTAVRAAMAGRVATTGVSPVYGRYVILSHGGGLQTLYAHLSRVLVDRGASVTQGAKIGEVGDTGYSTGPHLHFGVYRNGTAVDPLRFFE